MSNLSLYFSHSSISLVIIPCFVYTDSFTYWILGKLLYVLCSCRNFRLCACLEQFCLRVDGGMTFCEADRWAVLAYNNSAVLYDDMRVVEPLWSPVSTTRVDGPSWRVTGFHYPSTRAVNSGSGNRAWVSYHVRTLPTPCSHRVLSIQSR